MGDNEKELETNEETGVEKPKKKFKLISFKSKSDTITSLIIIVALVVVIFAGVNIIKIFANYKQGTDTYDELGNIVSVKQKPDEIQTFILDFNALKAVCPEDRYNM